MISWSNFPENVIDDFKNQACNFNHSAEINIITKANKMHMSYDFYIRHNMYSVEWNLNAMINKDKSLINNLDRNWRHLLLRKYSQLHFKN